MTQSIDLPDNAAQTRQTQSAEPQLRLGLMRFAAVGKDSPGALPAGTDAQKHVDSLREEWSERL